jgi:ABC-type methionine transport system ATPase subunit
VTFRKLSRRHPICAGKVRVLAFLQRSREGRIDFNGAPVAFTPRSLAALRRQVTLVAQSPYLFHRSVRANVVYGLRARAEAADGRVDDALEAVGLAGFANRAAWKLSGGEAQRVAIARALAIDVRSTSSMSRQPTWTASTSPSSSGSFPVSQKSAR